MEYPHPGLFQRGSETSESAEALLVNLERHLQRAELELRQLRAGYEALLKARLRVSEPSCQPATLDALTPRERRVAMLVATGSSNRQVAELLDVSVHTIKSQVRSILHKLDLHTRWQLVDARIEEPAANGLRFGWRAAPASSSAWLTMSAEPEPRANGSVAGSARAG